MATVENVNIEINQKLVEENKRLKEDLQKMHDGYDDVVEKFEAINQKQFDEIKQLQAENERLKEEQKLWVDYYNTISKLQADNENLNREANSAMDRLKYQHYELIKRATTIEQLQADKAELIEALGQCLATFEQYGELPNREITEYKSLLSKHETK